MGKKKRLKNGSQNGQSSASDSANSLELLDDLDEIYAAKINSTTGTREKLTPNNPKKEIESSVEISEPESEFRISDVSKRKSIRSLSSASFVSSAVASSVDKEFENLIGLKPKIESSELKSPSEPQSAGIAGNFDPKTNVFSFKGPTDAQEDVTRKNLVASVSSLVENPGNSREGKVRFSQKSKKLKDGDIVIVRKEYHAEELTELELEKGDSVKIIEEPDGDDSYWLKGVIQSDGIRKGLEGYFPRENVEFDKLSRAASTSSSIVQDESSILEPVPKGTTVIANFAFEPTKMDELSLEVGTKIIVIECPPGGWWKGTIGIADKNPITGWFPVSFVSVAEVVDISAKKLPISIEEEEVSESLPIDSEKKQFWSRRIRGIETEDSTDRQRTASQVRSRASSVLYSDRSSFTGNNPDLQLKSTPVIPLGSDSPVGRSRGLTISGHGGLIPIDELMRGASNENAQDRVGPAIFKLLSGPEKKRLSAIWELVQTERDYVRDLHIIIEIFMKPMSSLAGLGPKGMQVLFVNIEQIYAAGLDFLCTLNQIEDLRNVNAFSEAFMLMGERFMCYIPYCASQQANTSKFLKSMLGKADIKEFLQTAYQNPIVRQLDLPGFLLKPVQRICKYPLLLREIIKNTSSQHSDLVNLNRASEKMQSVVATINESARKLGGLKPIPEVQSRFSEKINIANANRFLVREDNILVMFSDSKKSRRLFLFNDLLILARKDWRDKLHVIEKTSLKDIRVCDIAEESGQSTSTTLLEIEILPLSEYDQPNRYIVSALSVEDKVTWLDAYKCLVRYNVKSKDINEITMTSSSADKAGDDDEERAIAANADEDNSRFRKLANSKLEDEITSLKSKLELQEKIILEKDVLIKEWESKIGTLTTDHEIKVKGLEDEIQKHLKTIGDEQKSAEAALGLKYEEIEILKKENAQITLEHSEKEELLKKTTASLKKLEEEVMQGSSAASAIRTELEKTISNQQVSIQKLENTNQSLLADLEKYAISDLEKDGVITQLQNEASFIGNRISDMVGILNLTSGLKDFDEFASRESLKIRNSKVKDSTTTINRIGSKAIENLDICRRAVEETLRKLKERTFNMESLNEQLDLTKTEKSKLEKSLQDKKTALLAAESANEISSRKIIELEKLNNEQEKNISHLKEQLNKSEDASSSNHSRLKKQLSEMEKLLQETNEALSAESDRVKILQKQTKDYQYSIQEKDNQLEEFSSKIKKLNSLLQATEGNVYQRDTHLKDIADRSERLQGIVQEIEILIKASQEEFGIGFLGGSSLSSQLKSFFATALDTQRRLQKGLADLEQSKEALKTNLESQIQTLTKSLQEKINETRIQDLELAKETERSKGLKATLAEKASVLEKLELNYKNLKDDFQNLSFSNETLKIANSTLEKKLIASNAELEESKKEGNQIMLRTSSMKKMIGDQNSNIDNLEVKISELQSRLKEKEISLNESVRKLLDAEALTKQLQSEIESTKSLIKEKVLNTEELKSQLSISNHEIADHISTISKLKKELHSNLETNSEIVAKYESEKSRIITQFEHEIKSQKQQFFEYETNNMALHQKLQQRELRVSELENNISDFKSKTNDLEAQLFTLQNKIATRDSIIAEYESGTVTETSKNSALKQRLAELEIQIQNFHTTVNDTTTRLENSEQMNKALNAQVVDLELNLKKYSEQISDQSEKIAKLSKEKLDLTESSDESEKTISKITKENRSLKDKLLNLEAELKTAKNNTKDAKRELQVIEEKFELLMKNQVGLRDAEIQRLTDELAKSKELNGQTKTSLENDLIDMKEQGTTSLNILKDHINELNGKVGNLDAKLLEREKEVKSLEIEISRLNQLNNKQSEELLQLKDLNLSAKEKHKHAQSILQDSLNDKGSKLQESLLVAENLRSQIKVLESQLHENLLRLNEEKLKVDKAVEKRKEQKKNHFDEISLLKTKIETLIFEKTQQSLVIERKTTEIETAAQNCRLLTENIELLQGMVAEKQAALTNAERDNQSAQEEISKLIKIEAQQRKDSEKLEKEIESLQNRIINLEEQLIGVCKSVNDKSAVIEAKQNEISILNRNIKDLEATIVDKSNAIMKLDINLSKVEDQCVDLKQQINGRLAQEHKSLQEKYEKAIDSLEETRSELQVAEQKNSQIEKLQFEIKKYGIEMENAAIQLQKVRQEYHESEENRSKFEEQIIRLQRLLSKESKTIEILQSSILEAAALLDWNINWKPVSRSINNLSSSQDLTEGFRPEEIKELPKKLKLILESNKSFSVEIVNLNRSKKQLEELYRKAQKELEGASQHIELFNENMKRQDVDTDLMVTDYKQKIVNLEHQLDVAITSKQNSEKELNYAKDQLIQTTIQKKQIERDYVTVYERLQATKNVFLQRTKAITNDMKILFEQLTEQKTLVQRYKHHSEELESALEAARLDADQLKGQLNHAERILKEVKESSSILNEHFATLKLEKFEMQSIMESLRAEKETAIAIQKDLEKQLQKSEHTIYELKDKLDESKDTLEKAVRKEHIMDWRNATLLKQLASKTGYEDYKYKIGHESRYRTVSNIRPVDPIPEPRKNKLLDPKIIDFVETDFPDFLSEVVTNK